MPQPTQNFLIHILLLWTTVISIIQIVVVILFFTAGHKGLDSSAVESSKISSTEKRWTTIAPSSPVLSKGKMLSFKFKRDGSKITWDASRPDKTLISEVNNGLSTNVDGYYFLSLQVTMNSGCHITDKSTVSLVHERKDQKDQTVLEGLIHKETNTTGILNKVVVCSAGQILKVNISKSLLECIDEDNHKTHLDIIFMPLL